MTVVHVRAEAVASATPARWRAWLPYALSATVWVVLVVRFGPGPFVAALRTVHPGLVAVAVGATFVTTLCSAVRWRAVAQALGVRMPLPAAVAAYYRSQLLNATLPGGVVGDVERGWRTRDAAGRSPGRAGRVRGLRAVAWERALGQAVQILAAVAALAVAPTALRSAFLPGGAVLGILLGVIAVGAALSSAQRRRPRPPRTGSGDAAPAAVAPGRRRHGAARPGLAGGGSVRVATRTLTRAARRIPRTAADDARALARSSSTARVVVATSLVATAGYVLVFALAAAAVGVRADAATLIPVALAVLVAGALPLNVAGWGPREGAAAALFALAGLPAAQGVAASVLFGVLMLVGVLPGVVTLWAPRRATAAAPAHPRNAAGAPRKTGHHA